MKHNKWLIHTNPRNRYLVAGLQYLAFGYMASDSTGPGGPLTPVCRHVYITACITDCEKIMKNHQIT